MSDDDFEFDDIDVDLEESDTIPAADPAVLRAIATLSEFFDRESSEVFYEKQLEVLFEDTYFHWITAKALKVLRENGRIGSELQALPSVGKIRFYFNRKNRYWKRKAAEIRSLVAQFSKPEFSRALGTHGELMVDGALPQAGFMPRGREVKSFGSKVWTETGHDLDRVYERDGIFYGAEIKNRLQYIDRDEFTIKLRMCKFLDLRPLFIARWMPKSYLYQVAKAGGFCLLMKWQFYPVGFTNLAKEVRARLQLPVDTPSRIADGTLTRLLNYHNKVAKRH